MTQIPGLETNAFITYKHNNKHSIKSALIPIDPSVLWAWCKADIVSAVGLMYHSHSLLLLSTIHAMDVPTWQTQTERLVTFTVSVRKACSLYQRKMLSYYLRLLAANEILRNDLGKKWLRPCTLGVISRNMSQNLWWSSSTNSAAKELLGFTLTGI